MLRQGNFIKFILKAIIFLVVVAACWYFVAPGYNRLLTIVSQVFIPGRADLQLAQNNIYIYSATGDMVGGIYLLSLHYGLILVIVLIAATPAMKLIQRLKSLGIAVGVVFFLNILSIILFARAALTGAASSPTQNPLIVLFAVLGSDLFPVIIWAGLSYKYFFTPKSAVRLKLATIQVKR